MDDNILNVREFNIIVADNKDINKFYNDERVRSLDKVAFEELQDFIGSAYEMVDDVASLGKLGKNGVLGEYVTIQNYVGMIELPCGKQIQVMPKIDLANTQNDNEQIRKSQRIMLDMLEYYFSNKFKVSGMARLDAEDTTLYEVFISMYIEEVRKLVKHGLKATYTRAEDNLTVLKGKLLFNEHIRYNIAHKERFYTAFDEYDINRPINKLIKSTLLKLSKETRDDFNMKSIKLMLACFVDVDESVNFEKDFCQVVIDRTLQDYEQLIEWSKILLNEQSFSNFSGDTGAKALLFPMEELFEIYVAEKLREVVDRNSDTSNWSVLTQTKEKHLFQKFNKVEIKKFLLKPDILIKNPDQKFNVVLDTKWKRLNDDSSNHFGIKPADMYQMFVYSKRYNAKHIWLIYPFNKNVKELIDDYKNDIIFESYEDDNCLMIPDVNIHVFFVDLENIEDSLKQLLDIINVRKVWS